MKRTIFMAMVFIALTPLMVLHAQWARTYGESAYDSARSPIQKTSDGGYILAGVTYSFGAGSGDVWVIKLLFDGTVEWERAYGGIDYDAAYSIQQTNDGGYIVAGETYSFGAGDYDFWILKLSSTGVVEWEKTYGGIDEDYAWWIQQTSDGGYIVVGNTYSYGAGDCDIWVLKLASNGSVTWQKTYGGDSSDYSWYIQQTSGSGYILCGETYSFGDYSDNIWVLKLSSAGSIEWQRIYGGADYDWSSTIQQTKDGGYIVVGCSYSFGAGDLDAWILKLTASGDITWQKTYGGLDYDYSWSIQQTSDSGYVVAGYTYSFGGGEDDVWVLKLSSSGAIQWQKAYGGEDYDYARSCLETSDGGYVVSGATWSVGSGEADFAILKLYSDGDIDPSCGFIWDSSASTLDTYVSPENTSIIPQDTDLLTLTTDASSEDTSSVVMLLCEAPKYTLTLAASTGGTTNPSPGSYTHYKNTAVTITAVASSGYQFNGWSGDVTGTTNPITVTLNADKSITANFKATFSGNGGDGTDGGKKGGCFIATAAYGSPLHSSVKILRDFKDRHLVSGKLGRAFVDFYYKHSPHAADFIAKHRALKFLVRLGLLPLVGFSYAMLHSGPAITLVLAVLILGIPVFFIRLYRKRRKACQKE